MKQSDNNPNSKTVNPKIDLSNFKGKYARICDDIYRLVGQKENYTKYYNCVTRLRFAIKDIDKVNIHKLKQVALVKGIVFNNGELQIIFGGEVYKIREAYDKMSEKLKKGANSFELNAVKRSKHERVISFLKGVIMPVLPPLMAGGLIMALQSILQLAGAIETINPSDKDPITDHNVITGVFYILSQTTLTLVGVMFCYNTVKYMKGNPAMGLLIGMSLASPFLFVNKHWTLFTLWGYDINVNAYGNQILSQVAAGILYIYVDRWIKMWMPPSIDLVFRHALSYAITIFPIFLLLGPILSVIETMITYALVWVGHAGYGIGAGIFVMLWQPLVLTGLHHTIMLPIKAEFASGHSSVLLLATSVNCFTQFGATLAVMVRTKNSNIRQACITSTPSCLLGVTEPIMYGVNLPKLRPFIFACIGGFAAGCFAGWLNATPYTLGGSGVLNVLRYINGGWKSIVNIEIINLIGLLVPFLLTLFFYHERLVETKGNKKVDSIVRKLYLSLTSTACNEQWSLTELNQQLANKTKLLAEHKLIYKHYETELIKIVSLDNKIRQLQSQIDSGKEKIAKQINRLQQVKQQNETKINALLIRFENDELSKRLENLMSKKTKLESYIEPIRNQIEKINADYLMQCKNIVNHALSNCGFHDDEKLLNWYFNVINSIDINYQFIEKKDNKIDWKSYPISGNFLTTFIGKLFFKKTAKK